MMHVCDRRMDGVSIMPSCFLLSWLVNKCEIIDEKACLVPGNVWYGWRSRCEEMHVIMTSDSGTPTLPFPATTSPYTYLLRSM